MALPKNKSRRIAVDNEEFRYVISISWKKGGVFDFNITVQHVVENGNKLLLKGLVTRDFWLDFSDLVGEKLEMERNAYPTITPKHIAYFVRKGIQEGWDFAGSGENFTLQVSNSDLTNQSSRDALPRAPV